MKKLGAALKKTPAGASQQVTDEAKAAHEECQALSKRFQTYQEEVDTIRPNKMDEFIAQVTKDQEELTTANKKCQGHLDGLNYIASQGVLSKRKETAKVRYARLKISKRLMAGGAGKQFSKLVAQGLEEIEPHDPILNPPEFSPQLPTLWTEQAAEPMLKFVADTEKTSSKTMQAHADKLKTTLAEHPKWGGAMIHLDVVVDQKKVVYPGFAELKAEDVQSPAMAPWLCCVKPHKMRIGPASTALPGIGAFVTLSTASAAQEGVALILLPADDMLKKGIALPDIEQFLETPTGAKFWKDNGELLVLKDTAVGDEKRVAWVPYGWIMLPLAWAVDKDTADDADETQSVVTAKGKDKDVVEPTFLFVHSLMSKPCRDSLTATTWKAIATWNGEHLEQNIGIKVWAQRAKHFKKWAEEVGTDGQGKPSDE